MPTPPTTPAGVSEPVASGAGAPAGVSAEQVARLRDLGLGGGIVAGLAERVVAIESARRQPGRTHRLITSAITAFADIGEGPLSGVAELIASPAPGRQIWRIAILAPSPKGAGRGSPVAEVNAVYELVEPALAAADPPPNAPQSESGGPDDDNGPDRQEDRPLGADDGEGRSAISRQRRRQIFEGACEVIAHSGFGNASMRQIAQAAGMSVPLMYKHIKDKDDILYLITSECMRDIIDYFAKAELFSGSPQENIRHAVETYIDYIGKNRRYINLVYSETRALGAEHRDRIFAMERRFLAYWRNLVELGVADGSFVRVDPELTANYIYFLCTVWSLRHWSIGHVDERTIKDSLTDLILNGLTATRAPQAPGPT